MLAKMQSAQARVSRSRSSSTGLSVDAEVKALDNVREHIKNTIAEANLGRELGDASLDSRLAALRKQSGDVTATPAARRDEGRAPRRRRARARKRCRKPYETHSVCQVLHHRRRHRRHRATSSASYNGRGGPRVGGRQARRRQAGETAASTSQRLRRAAQRAPGSDRARPDPTASRRRRSVQSGRLLGRTLVVGINTWAGHAPGIVSNGGLDPAAELALQEEVRPRREVRAHRGPGGQARRLPQGRHRRHVGHRRQLGARGVDAAPSRASAAKSIIMQDWSRGGDGIVSLTSINSIEDLKGKTHRDARSSRRRTGCSSTCSSQSGLTAEDRDADREELVFTQEAPLAAAMFKAKQVDAAVTWEPDLSGAVDGARRRGARAGVDDGGDQRHRRLPGRAAGRHRQGAGDAARLRARLVRRHRHDRKTDPARPTRSSAKALKLATRRPSPACSRASS